MKRCLNCGAPLVEGRSDETFCCGACKAASWRMGGNSDTHAKKPQEHGSICRNCGKRFSFNDYADRTGQRRKKYCSDSCRVNSYRQKKREASYNNQQEQEQPKRYSEPPHQAEHPLKTGNFRDSLELPRRWTDAAAYAWLGVPYGSQQKKCTEAFRELNQKYHPDTNSGTVWPHLGTVNAAYDYLKRRVFIHSK